MQIGGTVCTFDLPLRVTEMDFVDNPCDSSFRDDEDFEVSLIDDRRIAPNMNLWMKCHRTKSVWCALFQRGMLCKRPTVVSVFVEIAYTGF